MSRRRLAQAFVSPDSYGLVLVLIVLTYAAAVAQQAGDLIGVAVVFIQIATVWFVLRTAQADRAARAVVIVAMVITGLLAVAGGFLADTGAELMILLASTVLYLIAPVVVVRHLVARPVVDRETVLGVIAAYLLIGMSFSFVYRVAGVVDPNPFFGAGGEATPPQALFFSFTTLTTTGFGNLVPATSTGQTLAVAEMIIGQLFLILALGKAVSVWSPIRRERQRGDPPDAPADRR